MKPSKYESHVNKVKEKGRKLTPRKWHTKGCILPEIGISREGGFGELYEMMAVR
jgi:hypothetical protein